jgi:hypothetical protein
MADQVIWFNRNHGAFVARGLGDRGCVACGRVADQTPSGNKILIGDDRGRYWCLEHAVIALGNIRRRIDERDDYTYPWRFEDVGADGQCAILTLDECVELAHGLDQVAPDCLMDTAAIIAIDKVLERIQPKPRP